MEELKRYSMDYITYKLDAEFAQAVYKAADAIEALVWENKRLREANRWIPVSKRLPEGECLATCAISGFYRYKEMIIGYIGESKDSETGYIAESESEILGNVTHWRPLPKPPEGGTR